jgi:hypothetical protein
VKRRKEKSHYEFEEVLTGNLKLLGKKGGGLYIDDTHDTVDIAQEWIDELIEVLIRYRDTGSFVETLFEVGRPGEENEYWFVYYRSTGNRACGVGFKCKDRAERVAAELDAEYEKLD